MARSGTAPVDLRRLDHRRDRERLVLASVQDETYRQGQAILGVGVFAGQGAPAEAYFDDLEVTRR